MLMDTSLLGVGLYTLSEAAAFTDVSQNRIRRWVRGYRYRSNGEAAWSPPLWSPQLPMRQERLALGFRDLAEIRIVGALVDAGLGLRTVRKAMDRAKLYVDDERPFSTTKFRTDGKSIFLEVAEACDEPVLLDLLKRQYGIKRVLEPSFKDLDFNEEHAIRWWPLSRSRSVVLDPDRHFGQPIVSESGIGTRVLSDAVAVEGSVRRVADVFEVSPAEVRDAVDFETRLAA